MDLVFPELGEGRIDLGDERAELIGFLAADWLPMSYLWRTGNAIYLSLLWATEPGAGALGRLANTILGRGLAVKVPSPFPRMQSICERAGYTFTLEPDAEGYGVEVWVMEPGERPRLSQAEFDKLYKGEWRIDPLDRDMEGSPSGLPGPERGAVEPER